MKLSNVDVVPGVIVDTKDPKKLGRVKINAPALMRGNNSGDTYGVVETIDNNVLPWVYPLTMSRYQSFSKQLEGMKVWVLNNTENYNEYWYIPMFDYIDVTEEIVSEKYSAMLFSDTCSKCTSSGFVVSPLKVSIPVAVILQDREKPVMAIHTRGTTKQTQKRTTLFVQDSVFIFTSIVIVDKKFTKSPLLRKENTQKKHNSV